MSSAGPMDVSNIPKIVSEEFQKIPQSYSEAKAISQKIDDLLGFRCASIEENLFEKHKDSLFSTERQFWYGLELQSMQTPYSELMHMRSVLQPQPGQMWLDLGAAYGRMGIVLGFLEPEVRFLGYEFVKERVDEGNRVYSLWNIKNAELQSQDLADPHFVLPWAHVYFLYDFGSRADIYIVLEKMRIQAQKGSIQVIARGRGVRNWIMMDFPWLYDIHPPQHFTQWTIFKS